MSATGQRPTRRTLEVIRVVRTRCPRCGNPRLRKYRSLTDQGDGTAQAWVKCMNDQCGYRFRVVLE